MSGVALGLALILAGGLAIVVLPDGGSGRGLFRVLVGAGCAVDAAWAVRVLSGASLPDGVLPGGIPGGPWVFGLDTLSAVFLLAIVTVGAACALYGVPYLAGGAQSSVRRAHGLLALLIATLAAVVTARAVMPFLIAWEVMAIVSYLLIVFDDRRAAVRRAGLLYLVAMHVSLLALMLLFALWAGDARDLTFATLASRAPTLPAAGAAVLALALLGFGLKAGLVPLHVWLPEAHAAGPSHVSAIMSGVVIKMGVYGLLRVLALAATPPAWWGWLVLGLGVLSGVMGVVWALAQHDLKRLLAFHSVENVGIICMGIGAGALGLAYGMPAVAALGFAGAALHTLNHALFKSLLFLGAGSIGHETGVRELDRLGGLARQMPVTATTFLIGSAAIVGLPPLNGFVSEWLVYRSLLTSAMTAGTIRVVVLATAALALIGGLALACFAKVVGVVFLGRPREPLPGDTHEAPWGMTGTLVALAALCAAIGLAPAVVVPAALRVSALLTRTSPAPLAAAGPAAVTLTYFTLALGFALVLVWAVSRRRSARERRHAAVETWGCGFAWPTPRMQYTASSFAAPLVAMFQAVAGVSTERSAWGFRTHAHDPVLNDVALPMWHHVRAAARWLRPLQRGRLSRSLLYVVSALLVLLLYLTFAARAA